MSALLRRLPASRLASQTGFLAANKISIIQYPQLAARRYSTLKDEDGRVPAEAEAKKVDEISKPGAGHEVLKNLPSQIEERRTQAAKKFSAYMEELQMAMFTAGRRLNDLTGYSDIETLKKSIEKQENNLRECREAVKAAKAAYADSINKRSASQREVNELLQRKHAWSTTDLERFTELYRSDHANEQEEAAAQERLTRAEKETEEAQDRLSTSILARYHEEQIWSDKIRRASTWGTWGLMGFNVLLFIVVQLGLEPWKRKRLVGGFEEKVREVIQEENMRNALLNMHIEKPPVSELPLVNEPETLPAVVEMVKEVREEQPNVVEAIVELDVEEQSFLERLGLAGQSSDLKNAVTKLVSEDPVSLKKFEVTSIAVGSAATGAAVAIIGFLLNR